MGYITSPVSSLNITGYNGYSVGAYKNTITVNNGCTTEWRCPTR